MEFVAQRKAIPTEPNSLRRTVCHYCGHCMQGCEVDSQVHIREYTHTAGDEDRAISRCSSTRP